MALDLWLLFVAVSIVPAMSPGPAILMAMNNTLQYGPRATLISAVGNSTGLMVLGFAISFGLGSVMASSAVVFTVFKLAGAAYLMYLGLKVWRDKAAFSADQIVSRQKSSIRLMMEAFLLAVTNPKAVVILAVLFPPFLDTSTALMPQVLILSATFALLCYLNHLLVALFAKRLKAFIKSERRGKYTRRFVGGSFIGLGSILAGASQ